MKIFLAIMLLLSVSFSYTYAGDEYESSEKKESVTMEERAVIEYDFNFQVSLENGKAVASWDDFPDNKGFEWYKLVYSTTNTNPVYPHDKVVFIGERLQLSNTFKLDTSKQYHYVRLCAVVLNDDYSKDRYCSEVKKLETTATTGTETKTLEKKETVKEKVTEKKEEIKQKVEEKKEVVTKKVEEKKEEVKAKISTRLSQSLQTRINVMLEKFVTQLEAKGYSDEKNVELVTTVISRLETLGTQEKYVSLTSYMIDWLESKKSDYNSGLSDLEKVFSID